MKYIAFAFFSIALLVSCDEEIETKPNYTDINPNDVEIAVKNETSFQLDSFNINTSGGNQYYNSISVGSTSAFKTYRFSYDYFYIRFKVNEIVFLRQPIDYIGEEKIQNGQYRLKIRDIDTAQATFTYVLDQ